MTERLRSLASDLRIRDPEHVWGVSAESVYLALASVAEDEPISQGVIPSYQATVLATNTKRNQTVHTGFHEQLLTKLGLTTQEGELSNTGVIVVTAAEPLPLLRQLMMTEFPRIRRLLRRLPSDVQGFSRREFESFFADEYDEVVTAPLLGSMGFGELGPYGYEPNGGVIDGEVLYGQPDITLPVHAWTTEVVRSTTQLSDEELLGRVVALLEDEDGPIDVPDIDPSALLQCVDRKPRVNPDEIKTALSTIVAELDREQATMQKVMLTDDAAFQKNDRTIAVKDVVESSPALSQSAAQFVCDIVGTCRVRGVTWLPAEYLSRKLETTIYDAYQSFSSLPDVECQLDERAGIQQLRFLELPVVEGNNDCWEDIVTALVTRVHELKTIRERASNTIVTVRPSVRESLAVNQFEQLEGGMIEPTYFAYTLPDPDILGEEKMSDFVGDSTALRKERAKLQRWSKNRQSDLRRFTELTDELVSKGLHEELDERILRIMTPYDDDTFSEYASQFRQLLSEGYEIRLLTRHTRKKWQWERLRDNLLGELDTNRENVTIRTYSRYKEFERITSETDSRDLSEFGIHAKLQTIGHAKEGATLIGSANFMENSYDWNPECGVYTEALNFGVAAREFFDFVWDLSHADEVDLERLQRIPNREFYPTYYS